MRISVVSGFFLPVPPLRGGATEKIWFRLAQHFAAAGHEVTFVSRTWPGQPERETISGVHHLRLPGFDHTRHLPANLALDLLWGLRVGRALPPGDIVLCNTVSLPAWLPWVRPSAGKVAVVLGRIPKGQVRAYSRVSRIYATSTAVAQRAIDSAPSSKNKTRVIWNPIDWKLHAEAASHTPQPVRIGFVGRLHPEKGIDLLLSAASRLVGRSDLGEWTLELTGPIAVAEGGGGEGWKQALQSRHAKTLGSRLVWNLPEFDPMRLAARYGSIDIFCYPSLAETGETFGVAAAEAMAAGCAPVVSSLECFKDLVTAETTGLVFDHRAPDADRQLSDALARLILNPDLRRKIGSDAQAFVRRFDYPAVAANILADLASLS